MPESRPVFLGHGGALINLAHVVSIATTPAVPGGRAARTVVSMVTREEYAFDGPRSEALQASIAALMDSGLIDVWRCRLPPRQPSTSPGPPRPGEESP